MTDNFKQDKTEQKIQEMIVKFKFYVMSIQAIEESLAKYAPNSIERFALRGLASSIEEDIEKCTKL